MRFVDQDGNELPFTVRRRDEGEHPWLDLIESTGRFNTALQQPPPERITSQYESPLRHATQRPLSAQERERGLGITRQRSS